MGVLVRLAILTSLFVVLTSATQAEISSLKKNIPPIHKLDSNSKYECEKIELFLRDYQSNKVLLSIGDEKLDPTWRISPRDSCSISLNGPITERRPNVDEYLNKNGWETLNQYRADGACGGSLGYIKGFSGYSDNATFCVIDEHTNCNGEDGPPPTEFEIGITCVSGVREVIFE